MKELLEDLLKLQNKYNFSFFIGNNNEINISPINKSTIEISNTGFAYEVLKPTSEIDKIISEIGLSEEEVKNITVVDFFKALKAKNQNPLKTAKDIDLIDDLLVEKRLYDSSNEFSQGNTKALEEINLRYVSIINKKLEEYLQ